MPSRQTWKALAPRVSFAAALAVSRSCTVAPSASGPIPAAPVTSGETAAEFMIRGAGWKYAVYTDGEDFLYDLRKDPRETRNLATDASTRATRQEMRSQLAHWLRDTHYRGKTFAA